MTVVYFSESEGLCSVQPKAGEKAGKIISQAMLLCASTSDSTKVSYSILHNYAFSFLVCFGCQCLGTFRLSSDHYECCVIVMSFICFVRKFSGGKVGGTGGLGNWSK